MSAPRWSAAHSRVYWDTQLERASRSGYPAEQRAGPERPGASAPGAHKLSKYRFDGRVAIITGAGRGIGRAYAELLSSRGAHVVVNDLGAAIDGTGADTEISATTAAEIGGVADTNDVATEAGAAALVDRAITEFGRIDILINNAGIMHWAVFPDIETEDFARHLAVHLAGSFYAARAAWPHMAEQRYGRIVMTTSAGVFGLPGNASYAAAKAAVIGLTRSICTAGGELGIRANLIAPAAVTRMAGGGGPPMDPAAVAPMAAFLAHEDCPVSGEIYSAGGNRFARLFIASTPGYVSSGDPTIEDVAAHWQSINDEESYFVPTDLMDWSAAFTAHLQRDAS
jgi:NAD(P)-dependent dehydrogenase (short-subunit alcohol dehydrogenase family)